MKITTKFDVGERIYLAWQERRHNTVDYYGHMVGPLTIKHIRVESTWGMVFDTKADKPTGEVIQYQLKIVYEFLEYEKNANETNCFSTTKEAGDFNIEKLTALKEQVNK